MGIRNISVNLPLLVKLTQTPDAFLYILSARVCTLPMTIAKMSHPIFRCASAGLKAGGKPSNWLPPGRHVEQ